ncbi:MAG TPA: VWA domain-containing protein [Candidatus Omnitrophota bacterium]|nr:VWA domain-containing protein [Candidatus Omnitrophota bacterium]
MQFRDPLFFLLLLFLPVLFYWSRSRQKMWMPFSSVDERGLHGTVSLKILLYRLLPFLRLIVLALLIGVLARPVQALSEKDFETQGIDIVMSLDISGSMYAEDFKPQNRLFVAKEEAKNFIQGRQNDRIGLVIFAKKAYSQCPLTLDYKILTQLIDDVQIGMIEDGTAIGMGLATAVNRLKNSTAKSKVIILLTDGDNNAGNIDPVTAAELAKTFGIKVYTIGVGKGGLVDFPVVDPLFGKRYVQVEMNVDEFTLKRIADITGGKFFRARDAEGLKQVYAKIDQLERTEIKVHLYQSYQELFKYLLIPAVLLLFIELALARTVLLKIP